MKTISRIIARCRVCGRVKDGKNWINHPDKYDNEISTVCLDCSAKKEVGKMPSGVYKRDESKSKSSDTDRIQVKVSLTKDIADMLSDISNATGYSMGQLITSVIGDRESIKQQIKQFMIKKIEAL